MAKKMMFFVFIVIAVFFVAKKSFAVLGINPNACPSNDGGACVRQQMLELQQVRALNATQQKANNDAATKSQAYYNSQLQYYYKLDALEQSLQKISGQYFLDCYFSNSSCLGSGDPITRNMDVTVLNSDAFYRVLNNKVVCDSFLPDCIENEVSTLNAKCENEYGANSYSKGKDAQGNNVCDCKDGYSFDQNNQCIKTDDLRNNNCKNKYGNYAYFSNFNTTTNSNICSCMKGYDFNNDDQCAPLDDLCKQKLGQYGVGLDDMSSKQCVCRTGYVFSADKTKCETYDQSCQDVYGIYGVWLGQTNNQGGLTCGCQTGYILNNGQCALSNNQVVNSVPSSNTTTSNIINCGNNSTLEYSACVCNKGYSNSQNGCVKTISYAISKKSTTVRTQANAKAKIVGTAKANQKYQVINSNSSWVEIKFGKTNGWILKSLVKIQS